MLFCEFSNPARFHFMTARTLPAKDRLTICFAHVAYRLAERFALRNTGLHAFEVRSFDALKAHAVAPHMAAYAAKTKDLLASRAVHILSPA